MGDGKRALRVAVWCAVSTPQQATVEKDSLPAQERDGRAWAESRGGEVVATYVVPGHSRKLLFYQDAAQCMDAYRQLLADCEAQRFDVLWTRNRDRLGRTMALIAQVDGLVREVGGAEVFSAAMPHELGKQSGGMAVISTAFESSIAEIDNLERARRFRMGMRGRVLKRGLMGTVIPMGYTRIKDEHGKTTGYELDDYASGVDMATRLYLDGLSYTAVARRVNDAGYRLPSGARWRWDNVANVVGNDAYAGRPRLGPQQWEGEPQYPPLWDDQTWLAVQRERARRQTAPRANHGGNPYSGVAFCARCGSPMTQLTMKRRTGRYLYYVCSRHARRSQTGLSCHCNNIAQHRITSALVDYFYSLQTPERIDALLAEYGDSAAADRLRGEIAAAERDIANTETKRDRLALALAAGQMTGDIYRKADDVLLAELEGHQGRAAELARQLAALPNLDEWRVSLSDVAGEFAEVIESGMVPAATICATLQRAAIKIWCENGEITKIEP